DVDSHRQETAGARRAKLSRLKENWSAIPDIGAKARRHSNIGRTRSLIVLGLLQQIVDTPGSLLAVVVDEFERRHDPELERFARPAADEARGALQARNRVGLAGAAGEDVEINFRVPEVLAYVRPGERHRADARIAHFLDK